ncbi:MAG: HDIG domain-containing protein [Akkermansia sp.]|nr:HDIG domain-containing protein [Akkermansia sp.]
MFELISRLLRPGADAEVLRRTGDNLRKMLLMAALSVGVMYIMVGYTSVDAEVAVFRMAWLFFVSIALVVFYLVTVRDQELDMRRLLLCTLIILAQMGLMMGWNAVQEHFSQFTRGQLLLVLPYILAPSAAAVMVGRNLGIFMALSGTFFGVVLFPLDCPVLILADYIVVSFLTGVVSASLSARVHKREQIIYAGIASGCVVFVSTLILGLIRGIDLASLRDGFDASWFAGEFAVAVAVNFVVAVLINGLMPILEKIFNISTHITWLEWADMNHPILRKLQIAAPGTFHHSLYVQRLAEAAAEAIGADVTRAGVCGLYHDIGKINNPQYFAENIVDQTMSPHAELTPEASARIITAHVADGVEMANEHKLNSRIISVIREHHGVSTAYFFYRKALDRYEEEKRRFDEGQTDTCPDEVDKSIFTYKGPIPQTRESGIVSMADAVESATRSLQHPTEEDIRTMIDGIFKGRILDGHLQDCDLTLGEIAKMKESFFNTLRTMNHNRIAYPKPEKDDSTAAVLAKRKEETPEKS